MKTHMFARVVANAVSFPEAIQLSYSGLDPGGDFTLEVIDEPQPMSWEAVKQRFQITVASAEECEKHFREGKAVVLGDRQIGRPETDKTPNYVFVCPGCQKLLNAFVSPDTGPTDILVLIHSLPEGCGNPVPVLVETGRPL